MNFSPFRTIKALYSVAQLVRDPHKLNEVFEIADALATAEALDPVIHRLRKAESVDRAFADKHRIVVSIPTLRKLPEGTLGRALAEHMIAANLDPRSIPTLPSSTDMDYFRAHLYETHDIWHVVTGFGTDFVGELGLQGFYLSQIPSPLPSLLLAVGFLRSAIYDHALAEPLVEEIVRGWTLGRATPPLFGARWDELWELPLAEVRRRVGMADFSARDRLPLAA
jgi:ubiquinone biosynthesis protein COQ4